MSGNVSSESASKSLSAPLQQLALFTLPEAAGERYGEGKGGDGASVVAQASRHDEEKTEESLVDLALSLLLQEFMGSISDTQNETPDTTNETWGHLKPAEDPEYEGFRLESDTGLQTSTKRHI